MIKKYSYLSLLLSLCVLISIATAFAQIEQTSAALKKVEQNIKFATLSNGLRVIIYPRPIAPVFSGVVLVRVGGSDEEPGLSGIAHMLEHMAFKGTKEIGVKDHQREAELLAKLESLVADKKDSPEWQATMEELRKLWITDQFTREYDKRGAVGLNAYTTSELTAYYVDLPRSAFELWCYMESERIINPVMRQFYEERDVVREERRMRFEDDPEGKLYETMLSKAYTQHPYQKPVIGYDNELKQLTATQVKDFHDQYYQPSEMVLSLAGDIDPKKDLPLLEKYFGRITQSDLKPKRPTQIEPKQKEQREFRLELGSNPQIMLAYHKPVFPDPADPIISVMAEVLAGSKLSPLSKLLIEDKKIAVSISTAEAPGNAYPNLLIFSLIPKAPFSNTELLAEFDAALDNFKSDWNDVSLLENAKRSVAMSFLSNLKSNQGLALGLASDLLTFGSYKASSEWFSQAMQVSVEQIRAAATEYLAKENRTVGYLEAKKGK
jgi:predicted Zn-dependent peptidase